MILPPTDPEFLEHGEHVATISGSSRAMEFWVRAVAEHANARLDWRRFAGRGFVLHLGDANSRARVEAAVTLLAADLDGEILKRVEAA